MGERNPFSTPGPLEQAGGYIAHQVQSMGLDKSIPQCALKAAPAGRLAPNDYRKPTL